MKIQNKLNVKGYRNISISLILIILLGGCSPASCGILTPGQKSWHERLDEKINDIREGKRITKEDIIDKCGKPDAIVRGRCFISNYEELDKLRALG